MGGVCRAKQASIKISIGTCLESAGNVVEVLTVIMRVLEPAVSVTLLTSRTSKDRRGAYAAALTRTEKRPGQLLLQIAFSVAPYLTS